MINSSRRTFLTTAALGAAAGFLRGSAAPAKNLPFGLGIASYSFRAFTLDQAIAMTTRLGIGRLALKDVHMPLTGTGEDIAQAMAKIKNAGLTLTTCGVVYMSTEAEVQRAFAYAKAAGVKFFVGAPDVSLLPVVEKAVRATDIALAIHNHGPTDGRYPGPENVYRLVEKMDKRMGLCIDCGHTQRLGVNPADEAERFFDRLIDLHVKDVSASTAAGETVEIGRGVIDIPELLRTLIRLRYSGTLHVEFEKDKQDPLAGVAESVGYLRGALAAL